MRSVIEMAFKSLFLPQNHKNHPAAGASPSGSPVIHLSCIGLFSSGPKEDNFMEKIIFGSKKFSKSFT